MSNQKLSADRAPVGNYDEKLYRSWPLLLRRATEGVRTIVTALFLSAKGSGTDGVTIECPAARQAFDELLQPKDETGVQGIAFAIFRQRIWKAAGRFWAEFFSLCSRVFLQYQTLKKSVNGRGMYYECPVKYVTGPYERNQSERTFSQCDRRKGIPTSLLQAATFHPEREHVASAQPGFPCLQPINFAATCDSLAINVFNATQQTFNNSYGHCMCVSRFGDFVAHEMDMTLGRLNVMVGPAQVQGINRSDPDFEPLAAARTVVCGAVSPIGIGYEANTFGLGPRQNPARGKNRGSGTRVNEFAATAAPLFNFSQRRQGKPTRNSRRGWSGPLVLPHLSPAKVSDVYDSLWRFAVQRQDIFFKRVRREPPPWTDDAVLSRYKFTNAYRASDRVSQYLIRHVIYRADLPDSPSEVFFRILLFKLFNKIETWKMLERTLGSITFEDYDFSHYDDVLTQEMQNGGRIYSAAYIMPPGSRAFGRSAKHQNHLLLLEQMMEDRLPERLAQTRTMHEAFEKLRAYPTIGDFLAYQFITDINYSEITDFSEEEFVAPGPGARDGLRKCFIDTGDLNEPELIRLVTDLQEKEFKRLELDFQTLWGRRLQLIDCQNLFCEVGKYARVAHPEVEGSTGRTRIKQKFQPTSTPMNLFYPPKWELNSKIVADANTTLGNPGGARDATG